MAISPTCRGNLLRASSLTGCKVSVRVLTPREFRTMPPVKFSLAEILVSDSVTGISRATVLRPTISYLSLFLSSSNETRRGFCRSSINVIREHDLFMKGSSSHCPSGTQTNEMDTRRGLSDSVCEDLIISLF